MKKIQVVKREKVIAIHKKDQIKRYPKEIVNAIRDIDEKIQVVKRKKVIAT